MEVKERLYKLNDIRNAIEKVHPTDTPLSKMTMIRYLKNDIGYFEKQDNKHGGEMYLLTRQTILDIADEYNRTRAVGRVDIQSVLDILDGLDTPEVKMQKYEERVKHLEDEIKDKELLKEQLRLKEEEIKSKEDRIDKLIKQVNAYEVENQKLISDGKEKDDKLKKYLVELDIYNTTNPIVRLIKGIKRPKLDF